MVGRILITGASGWIGRATASVACRSGAEVVGLASRVACGPWCHFVPLDLTSDGAFKRVTSSAIGPISAIIHCAGHAHRPLETVQEIERFDRVNRIGCENVAELARRLACNRLVYVSTIAFYDWSRGVEVAEGGLVRPQTAYARSKFEGEVTLLKSGLDVQVARLATVFGGGDIANFSKLASAMGRRRFAVPGKGGAIKSVIPVDLAAELLVDLALGPETRWNILNLALPRSPTLAEICEVYADVCGFPPPRHLPLGLLRLVAAAGTLAEVAFPGFPITSNTLGKLTTDTCVNVDRMLETWPNRKWPSFREALERHGEYYRSIAQCE